MPWNSLYPSSICSETFSASFRSSPTPPTFASRMSFMSTSFLLRTSRSRVDTIFSRRFSRYSSAGFDDNRFRIVSVESASTLAVSRTGWGILPLIAAISLRPQAPRKPHGVVVFGHDLRTFQNVIHRVPGSPRLFFRETEPAEISRTRELFLDLRVDPDPLHLAHDEIAEPLAYSALDVDFRHARDFSRGPAVRERLRVDRVVRNGREVNFFLA